MYTVVAVSTLQASLLAAVAAFGESKTLEEALELVLTFITTPCSMEEKHVRRRTKVINYEEQA